MNKMSHVADPFMSMRQNACEVLESIIGDKEPFPLRVGWARSFDDLLAQRWERVSTETALTEAALTHGRVLISAEAGSGKTQLLARVGLSVARSENAIPVWVALRDVPAAVNNLLSLSADTFVRALVSLSAPSLRPVLTSRVQVPKILLLADGINEVPKRFAQPTFDALDEIARRYPFVSVIVTERLVRRQISSEKWRLATLLPLREKEIIETWRKTHEAPPPDQALDILKNPFFLDNAMGFSSSNGGSAELIGECFHDLAGLSPKSIDRLSEAAFKSYSSEYGMLMPKEVMAAYADSADIRSLARAGMLRTEADVAWFSHHLFHDYLASRYLVRNRHLWGPGSFDVVTTGAASFDSLRLAVDQIDKPAIADEFVRLVYDWNYFGAAYALVPGRVSRKMQVQLLAMLADKRWDPVEATVEMVTDALSVDGSSIAQEMLSAPTRNDLFRVVRDIPSDDPGFDQWKKLFTFTDGEYIDAYMVRGLCSEDPIASWTLANVLRRCRLTRDGEKELIDISRSASPVWRWRAVHALGLHPNRRTEEAVKLLLRDPDRWVRYGAVRSLVEMAARTSEYSLRSRIIAELMKSLNRDELDEKMIQEMVRVLDVRPQPDEWPASVAPLIQQLASTSSSLAEQERWTSLMARILESSREK
jgi:hypothetical protein